MKFWNTIFWLMLALLAAACDRAKNEHQLAGDYNDRLYERGGSGSDFKIPLLPGYDWEITQSWGDHCEQCDELYPEDETSYCDDSHMLSADYFGWDFNLPGESDSGKEALASADGNVKEVGYGEAGWGHYVIVDHGNNICTRYAHLLTASPLLVGQRVCQGLVVGSIGGTPNWSPHLHFQFEECDTGDPIAMGFTDGNAVPMCRKVNAYHDDTHDQQGRYIALQLTNQKRVSCNDQPNPAGNADLDDSGWNSAACGGIQGCPLNQNCNNGYNHRFNDANTLTELVESAANYLYAECAVNGYADGTVRGADRITRAEALKIPMTLFNLVNANCSSSAIPYTDVANGAWYRGVVACALRNNIINSGARFSPDARVNIAEAVKMAVLTAVRSGKIHLVNSNYQHFRNVPANHWAYQYVETAFAFGAPIDLDLDPARTLRRGEYMTIVASFSPCFCENVDCDGGCQCSQSNYSCSDPGADNGEEEGGMGNDDLIYNGEVGNQLGFGVNFTTKPGFQVCSGQSYDYVIGGTMRNNGNQPVYVNRLTMSINSRSDASDCQMIAAVTNANGVSTQRVNPGESVNLRGSFTMRCSSEPDDGAVDVIVDLMTRRSGTSTVYEHAVAATTPLERGMVAGCQGAAAQAQPANPPQPPASQAPSPPPPAPTPMRNPDGTCNFNGPFNLWLFSIGASMDILTGTGERLTQPLYRDTWTRVTIECNELPVAVLVHGIGNDGWVSTDPATNGLAQPLLYNFWSPYEGILTLQPQVPRTGQARHSSYGGNAMRSMLIGIGF